MKLLKKILLFCQCGKNCLRISISFLTFLFFISTSSVASLPCGLDSVVVNQPTCNSLCNASILVYAYGDGDLFYNWQQLPGIDSSYVEGLCNGSYVLTVTDTAGCSVSDTIQVFEPDPIAFNVSTQATTCPGGCTGSITILPSDTLPYTYHWPGYLSTTSVLQNICQGTYNAIITNSSNCSILATINVGYNPPFELSFITTPSTCLSSCDGTASVFANVNGVFNYQWLTGPIQNSQTAFNLCIGSYIVTVTDSLGCVVSDSVYIDALAPPIINSTSISPMCFGGCDGSAEILVDTTMAFDFEWNTNPQQFGSVATGLCEGVYSFLVTDLASGCTYVDSVIVSNPVPFSVSAFSNPSSCINICNGSVIVYTNAPPPLIYQWSSGSSSESDSLLCPGLYTVTIVDSLGCIEIAVVNVSPQSPSIITSNSTCNTICDGTAEVLIPFPGDWDIEWNTIPVQTDPTATALCEGVYFVELEDSSGCELSATAVIAASQPIAVTSNSSEVSCYGNCDGIINLNISGVSPLSVIWNTNPPQYTNTIMDLCAGAYVADVTDGQGCSLVDTVIVGSPLMPDFIYSVLPNSCSGICNAAAVVTPVLAINYNILWQTSPVQSGSTATGLCPGPTAIIAVDTAGCIVYDTLNIIDTSPINPNLITFDVSCIGDCDGFLNCQPWGGTPGYVYEWSNGFVTPQLINVCPGTYTVTVTDAMGCTISNTGMVNEPDSISLAFTITPSSCALCGDGAVAVNATGGTPPYVYLWSPGGVQGPVQDSLVAGLYSICVIDDNSCSNCQNVFVTSFNGLENIDQNKWYVTTSPNPFNSETKIIVSSSLIKNDLDYYLKIFDTTGKEVDQFKTDKEMWNESTLVFSIIDSGAAAGMYFVNVISEDSIIYTGKIVFSHDF